MGFMVAASVRVGNALGAGNIEQAKASGKVAVICACKNKCIQAGYFPSTAKALISTVNSATSS